MHVVLCALVAFGCVANTFAEKLPSFIKPCSASDASLNRCVENVIINAAPIFAEGIPELGIAPLDPVELGTVKVDNSDLKIIFTDTVVTGLKNMKLNSYVIFPKKGKAALDFTANVTLKAHYVMDGQVLILPIKGNGQSRIKITNLNIVIEYEFDTVNGFWVVTSYHDKYKMDRAQFKFQNLFNGNKNLADTTSRFLNSNWSIIMQEIGAPAVKHIIVKCVEEVRKLLQSVPVAELLLP